MEAFAVLIFLHSFIIVIILLCYSLLPWQLRTSWVIFVYYVSLPFCQCSDSCRLQLVSTFPLTFPSVSLEAHLRLSRCRAGKEKPSVSSYLISAYFYCRCHGDIHLSAEATLQHPDNSIWQFRRHLERLGWMVSTLRDAQRALLIGWRTDSWLRGAAAANWWGKYRVWLTGLMMHVGTLADSLFVILHLRSNFFIYMHFAVLCDIRWH